MFSGYPTYSRYRNLILGMQGEDVYALQTALGEVGIGPGYRDGIFGKGTRAAVLEAQRRYQLDTDGVAGGATQDKLCSVLCLRVRGAYDLPSGLMYGQIGHESGRRLGNYSWILRPDGTFDAGVAQRNSKYTPLRDGFDAAASIDALARNTREHFDLFEGVLTRRRWELAAGAWNAPAYACWIANEQGAKVPRAQTARPGAEARQTLEAYMKSATALLKA